VQGVEAAGEGDESDGGWIDEAINETVQNLGGLLAIRPEPITKRGQGRFLAVPRRRTGLNELS
jgi:hypothetical protein